MVNDGIQDLATVSTFPYFTLKKLSSKMCDIISHSVKESLMNNEDICEIDIGIGKLLIGVTDDLKFKFIPNDELESGVIKVFNGGESTLIENVESAIKSRVISAYKDLY
jgi:hypothetical protein